MISQKRERLTLLNVKKGLIVAEPWIGDILNGTKIWEMRSQATSHRGWFGLIRKGTGAVSGVARLVHCGAPLSDEEMISSYDQHRIPDYLIRNGQVAKWRIPWELSDVRSLANPVPYRHRSGAVTWVQLDPDVTEAIDRALGPFEEAYSRADQAEMNSPRQIVFQSLEIMREGLHPYVTAAASVAYGSDWEREVATAFQYWRSGSDGHLHFDTQKLLQVMDRFWNNLFRPSLDRSHRSIVNELIDIRNRVAHDGEISEEDAERALDSMRRLLAAIGAHDAAGKIALERETILRARYGKQSPARVEASASSNPTASSAAISTIEPTTAKALSAEPRCTSSRVIGEVSITQGNIDNNHIYLRSIFDRFPADAKGGSNKASSADKTVTVDWGGPELVKTDLDSEKKFFRSRAWIAAFFRLNTARPGDTVRIEETGPYCYRVTLVR